MHVLIIALLWTLWVDKIALTQTAEELISIADTNNSGWRLHMRKCCLSLTSVAVVVANKMAPVDRPMTSGDKEAGTKLS